jgi:HSP20 family protein
MLTTWNPWQDLYDIERQMTDLLRTGIGTWPVARRTGDGGYWNPAVDVFTRQGDLVIRAELPGIDPEGDVEITVQDGMLTLRGDRQQESKMDDEGYSRFESWRGYFVRHVPLPEGVKADSIQAAYENGILEVIVPKAAELSAAKKIPISKGVGRRAISAKGTGKSK